VVDPGEEVRFASDSPLEEAGFEPLVPRQRRQSSPQSCSGRGAEGTCRSIGGAPDFCRLRCERRLGAVMARFIGATTDQGATHDRQGAPHQALGAITRAAPLFSTRLRWLCPATTRSFTRGPLASSLVMSASYQTDQNRKWQGPSHLPSSKRGDALSLRRCSWIASNPCRPCPPYRRPAAFRRPPWVPACRPPCPRW